MKRTSRGWNVAHHINGFLRKNCGRPWNDVHSEVTEMLNKLSYGVRSNCDYALHNVAVNTWRGESGKVWNDGKRGPEIVNEYKFRWHGIFYVEPETGILREAVHASYKAPVKPIKEIKISDTEKYLKEKEIWYHIHYKYEISDLYSNNPTLVIADKRQLGKKRLRDLKGVLNAI